MTSARRHNTTPHGPPPQAVAAVEHGPEAAWPAAFRALLLLSEAAHPGDAALTRLSDEDLDRLRASLLRLAGGEGSSVA